MEFLVPLGLLGLLGIAALILIYIIKPNYQVKHISSTYVWELSLKYRKKRIPTSPLRNILIFICEFLALVLMAGILAMPVIVHRNQTNKKDVIAVVDSSASMYALSGEETRFNRALGDVIALAREVFAEDGNMSVIIADQEPHYLVREVSPASGYLLFEELEAMQKEPSACYYGTSDIDRAMKLCEEVLADNPSAQVHFFTDTQYRYVPEDVTVVNVCETDEWNAGILTATAEIEDMYQTLTVDIASYGRAVGLVVRVEVFGANAMNSSDSNGTTIRFTSEEILCNANVTTKIIFKYYSTGSPPPEEDNIIYHALLVDERFRSYQSIHISLEMNGDSVQDSFSADNSFDVFGGQKEVLRVQYASSRNPPRFEGDMENPGPNPFVNGALGMVQRAFQDRWDIIVTEVKPGNEPALQGFDLYIFEHDMPEELPTDGVVFLLDPTLGWVGGGIEVIDIKDMNKIGVYLMENVEKSDHPVLNDPDGFKAVADNITVSRYKVVTCDTDDFEVLMTCDTDPVLMVRKNGSAQVAVMSFSVHYSNLPRINEMSYLFYNLFDYYFPGMVNKNAFEVGEELVLGARGPEVEVTRGNFKDSFTEFPCTYALELPGSYTVRQKTYFGKDSAAEIFTKIPAYESDILRTEDTFSAPYRAVEPDSVFDDLLIYLAAALFVLLFAEWLLHAKEEK